jgi:hypothetical protein
MAPHYSILAIRIDDIQTANMLLCHQVIQNNTYSLGEWQHFILQHMRISIAK